MRVYLYCSNFEAAGYDRNECCISCHSEWWDRDDGGYPMERTPVNKITGEENYLNERYHTTFCCGMIDWIDSLSKEENRKAFAAAVRNHRRENRYI